MSNTSSTFEKKVLLTLKYGALVGGLLALLILGINIFLIAFGGIIVAVLLRGLARRLENHTDIPHPLAIITVLFTIVGAFVLVGFLFAPGISEQFNELAETLPQSLSELEAQFGDTAVIGEIVTRIGAFDLSTVLGQGNVLSQVTGAASATVGVLANIFIVLFVGVYGAIEPKLYTNGFISLFPKSKHDRVREILHTLRSTLTWWLAGQLMAMAVIGVLTTAGLMVLGIPLAPLLGLIAALLAFIPNLGPVLSAVPAILLGFLVSPQAALFVVLLYIGVQFVESYLLTPLIQRKTISLPPALVLVTQILFGVWFGLTGLILAAPLTAMIIVLVQEVYIKDMLEK